MKRRIYAYTKTLDTMSVYFDEGLMAIKKDHPGWTDAIKAVHAGDGDAAWIAMNVDQLVSGWTDGTFKVVGGHITMGGERIPPELERRAMEHFRDGRMTFIAFLRFWERLSRNPSMRSVESLYRFMTANSIPIDKDGYFYAFKGVTADYLDQWTRTLNNRPGNFHEVPRNKVSDDPRAHCHYGLHVGSLRYALGYGTRQIVCRVDPEHVVCVPYDSAQKMRACQYAVVAFSTGANLPMPVFDPVEVSSGIVEGYVDTPMEGVSEEEREKLIALSQYRLRGEEPPHGMAPKEDHDPWNPNTAQGGNIDDGDDTVTPPAPEEPEIEEEEDPDEEEVDCDGCGEPEEDCICCPDCERDPCECCEECGQLPCECCDGCALYICECKKKPKDDAPSTDGVQEMPDREETVAKDLAPLFSAPPEPEVTEAVDDPEELAFVKAIKEAVKVAKVKNGGDLMGCSRSELRVLGKPMGIVKLWKKGKQELIHDIEVWMASH